MHCGGEKVIIIIKYIFKHRGGIFKQQKLIRVDIEITFDDYKESVFVNSLKNSFYLFVSMLKAHNYSC